MLLWPPSPIFNVGRKVTILFGAKSNIVKGGGGYLKSDAAFPTLLSRIVVCSVVGAVEVIVLKIGGLSAILIWFFCLNG